MKRSIAILLVLLSVVMLVSCTSSRKCGKKKGISTPMGVM